MEIVKHKWRTELIWIPQHTSLQLCPLSSPLSAAPVPSPFTHMLWLSDRVTSKGGSLCPRWSAVSPPPPPAPPAGAARVRALAWPPSTPDVTPPTAHVQAIAESISARPHASFHFKVRIKYYAIQWRLPPPRSDPQFTRNKSSELLLPSSSNRKRGSWLTM